MCLKELKMKNKVLLILSIICIILSSCTNGMPVEDQLQEVLDQGIAKYETQGVSTTVIFPNGEIWNGVSGMSHDTVPIDPNMVFAIGSDGTVIARPAPGDPVNRCADTELANPLLPE